MTKILYSCEYLIKCCKKNIAIMFVKISNFVKFIKLARKAKRWQKKWQSGNLIITTNYRTNCTNLNLAQTKTSINEKIRIKYKGVIFDIIFIIAIKYCNNL